MRTGALCGLPRRRWVSPQRGLPAHEALRVATRTPPRHNLYWNLPLNHLPFFGRTIHGGSQPARLPGPPPTRLKAAAPGTERLLSSLVIRWALSTLRTPPPGTVGLIRTGLSSMGGRACPFSGGFRALLSAWTDSLSGSWATVHITWRS